MHRASTILTTTRLDKDLTHTDISQKTKIPIKYLLAIENEAVADLPDEPYCSLIVNDYAQFLGLNGQHILSLFRRDILTRRRLSRTSRSSLSITPRLMISLTIIVTFFAFTGYLFFEYLKFNRPPRLEVDWPQKINNSSLIISGITDPESTIRINDDLVIVDIDGKFSHQVTIGSQSSKIIVKSQSRSGQTAVEEKLY